MAFCKDIFALEAEVHYSFGLVMGLQHWNPGSPLPFVHPATSQPAPFDPNLHKLHLTLAFISEPHLQGHLVGTWSFRRSQHRNPLFPDTVLHFLTLQRNRFSHFEHDPFTVARLLLHLHGHVGRSSWRLRKLRFFEPFACTYSVAVLAKAFCETMAMLIENRTTNKTVDLSILFRGPGNVSPIR